MQDLSSEPGGLNLYPLQWKRGVLTTGIPFKVYNFSGFQYFHKVEHQPPLPNSNTFSSPGRETPTRQPSLPGSWLLATHLLLSGDMLVLDASLLGATVEESLRSVCVFICFFTISKLFFIFINCLWLCKVHTECASPRGLWMNLLKLSSPVRPAARRDPGWGPCSSFQQSAVVILCPRIPLTSEP